MLIKLGNKQIIYIADEMYRDGLIWRCFHDPDKVVIEIGEPMDALVQRLTQDGMTDEEIVKKTTLPLELVRVLLASNVP